MTKKIILLIVTILALGLVACSSETAEATGEQYGMNLTLAKATPIGDVLANVADLNGQVERVSGTVDDLCKHKGCWMQVKNGEQVLTVRFKDEAFTLPAEALGKSVDFEGLLIAEKISKSSGEHSGCAEGGEHSGGEACESERAEKALQKTIEMRYTMISTGLVLL